jgi:hypothetical protein
MRTRLATFFRAGPPFSPVFPSLFLSLALVTQASAQPVPIITSQPQAQDVAEGDTITFLIIASNATRYQWLFNGANLQNATGQAWTLINVNSVQAGKYSVVVFGPGV